MARAKLLYDKGAIALADLESAEDTSAKAAADLNAAIMRVRVLGGDMNHPSPHVPLRAPISGTIVDQQITGGTGVRSLDNQPALFTIADLSAVWVLCDVYQDMLPRVHVGDIAAITLNGYAEVSRQSNQHQPGAGSGDANCEGPDRAAQPEWHDARGHVRHSDLPLQPAVQASSGSGIAVVHLHDKDWVYMPAGQNRFRRVAVQLGPQEKDGSQEVISGLKRGTRSL